MNYNNENENNNDSSRNSLPKLNNKLPKKKNADEPKKMKTPKSPSGVSAGTGSNASAAAGSTSAGASTGAAGSAGAATTGAATGAAAGSAAGSAAAGAGAAAGAAAAAGAGVILLPIIIALFFVLSVAVLSEYLTPENVTKTAVEYVKNKFSFENISTFFSNLFHLGDNVEKIEASEDEYDKDNEYDVGLIENFNAINTALNYSYDKYVTDYIKSYCSSHDYDYSAVSEIIQNKYPNGWRDVYSNVNYGELIVYFSLGYKTKVYGDDIELGDPKVIFKTMSSEDNVSTFFGININTELIDVGDGDNSDVDSSDDDSSGDNFSNDDSSNDDSSNDDSSNDDSSDDDSDVNVDLINSIKGAASSRNDVLKLPDSSDATSSSSSRNDILKLPDTSESTSSDSSDASSSETSSDSSDDDTLAQPDSSDTSSSEPSDSEKVVIKDVELLPFCQKEIFRLLNIDMDVEYDTGITFYDMSESKLLQVNAICEDATGLYRKIYYTLGLDKPKAQYDYSFSSSTVSGLFGLSTVTVEGAVGENSQIVWHYLKTQGKFTDEGAAGIMGNLMAEHGFNTSMQGEGGSVGIAQWTGKRKEWLEFFAKAHSGDVTDINIQAAYLTEELQNKKYDCIRNANNVMDAADYAAYYYEACSRYSSYDAYLAGKYAGKIDWHRYVFSYRMFTYILDLDKRRSYSDYFYELYKGTL